MSGKPQHGPRSARGLLIGSDGMDKQERRSYLMRCRRAEKKGLPKPPARYADPIPDPPTFGLSMADIPDEELPVHEIIARRKLDFKRKLDYEEGRKLIQATVHLPGPIGILHFGDPHLDDDGTDWDAVESHIKLVQRTEGLFAANIGDTTNNWVGRLAKLYSVQTVTARQAWRLAEWFFNELAGKLVYVIAGNHDAWSGEGDPLHWIARNAGTMYEASEARVQVTFPKGSPIVVNARHDFSGSSQWNPTHGPMKAAQLGVRDDIMICGHKHKSGYSPLKDPESGKVCHCIQVASYKRFDRYAREKGFRDQALSPCVLTIIDPQAEPVNRVQIFWDPVAGAKYLTFLRRGL